VVVCSRYRPSGSGTSGGDLRPDFAVETSRVVHMLRHSTGYALAGRGMDTRRLQHYLGHASITNTVRYTAMSPEPFKDIWR
jgi:site-specific recombinase XerD